MSLFERLQKSRGQQASALATRLEQQGQKTFKKDPRIWKWTWNDKGVSENTIRLLPIPMVDMKKQEDGDIPEDQQLTPVAMVIRHQFQGPGGWYINNSPQTFGEDDPVRDHDQPLWQQQKATNDETLKTKLKSRLPDTKYYVNILVIKDKNVPENNGKVMLMEYGAGLKKFIDSAQSPKFETDKPFDPYDPWEGADLIMNMVGEEKAFGNWKGLVPNFGTLKWATPAPMGDEAFIEEIWSKEHSLFEFFDRKNYKSYTELEAQLRKVLQIPNDQPLSEHGASNMAHSPTQEQHRQADSTSSANTQEEKKVEPQKQTEPQPNNGAGGENTLDDFAQYLQE